ncbi:hypothetical protein P691DRAFT_776811 [Macrolepiota fuliginosa MF-IS2]|uniref:Uncharacterized protein n=1 Tax=Macrolepiota fuliginosa MF-IS2 TaxID=1400762 RepID=A0A9P5XBC7_9AGAR|nr:hypothetical protein P691DRAFT_776811 [Macrolepiota fuliginosa MF-IS2]
MADSISAYEEVGTVFTAALIFGMYLITLLFCFRWLLFDDDGWNLRERISWTTVLTAFLIFAFNLLYLVLSLRSTIAMVKYLSDNPGGPGYHTPHWDSIVKCTSANFTALLADCALIYRCWVVYGECLAVVVFPILLWLGSLVCTALQMYLQIVHVHNPLIGPRIWGAVNMTLGPGIVLIPFWASTAVLNGYATFMLIRRIYRISTICDTGTSARQFRFIMRILAESGFLYLSITIAHLVTWFTSDNVAIQILSMINMPVIGIAFNLVLIRASQTRAEKTALEEIPITQISELHFRQSSLHSTC